MVKKRKRGFSLKEEYRKCWDYLKESKKFIYSIVLIFLIFAIIGFFIPAPDYLIEQIMEFIEEILGKTEGMSQGRLIGFLFWNNLRSSFFGVVLGVLFGIFPILATIANGYILGFVSSLSVANGGILSLWRILPHGIFELPAIFISLGLGLKLGTFVFRKDRQKLFREDALRILIIFLLIVVPLLVIASIIEGSLIALG
jgi:stage II sporulation protein M